MSALPRQPAHPPAPCTEAERDAALRAVSASERVAALLRVAGHLLDEFTPPVSAQACALIEEIAAIIAAAECFNDKAREFLNARC